MTKPQRIFVALLVFSCAACKNQKDEKLVSSNRKPNIIYILADDLGYGDLSSYGQTRFKTPNIDRLAENGMLFSQHYAGNSVCAPSRSVLFTGLHTGHTPIRGNIEIFPEGQEPLPDSIFTVFDLFKSAGYVTGVFGKWGLGYPGSQGDPVNQSVDQFYGYNCQRFAHHYYPYYLWDNNRKDSLHGNKGENQRDYAPDVIHHKAMAFMKENKSKSFFLFYPTSLPHANMSAPEDYMKRFRGKYLPEKTYHGYDKGPEFRTGPYESQMESHAAFVAMIDYLDHKVGEIVKEVEALGIADDTIIIFASDNGPHNEGGGDAEYFDSNGMLKGYKRDLYEGGIRVPMIVSWPGTIKSGSKSNHVSSFWDFLPTVSELINQPFHHYTDGVSYAPTLLGSDQQEKHDYLYWEFHEKGGRKAARKGKWKAVKYNILDKSSQLELYNLSNDIGEEKNLASEYPEIAKEMEDILIKARTSSTNFNFTSGTYLDVK